jgi:uncharacterized lipoprotein YddW (UPF0748 family)
MRAGRFEGKLETSMPTVMKEEWLARGINGEYGLSGKYGELMWLDPTNPEVEQYLLSQYEELIANYSLDGIELDAIRYPISNLMKVKDGEKINDHGYTASAAKLFKAKHPFEGDLKDAIRNNMDLRKDWVRFRSDVLTNLVEKIYKLVIKKQPKLWFSAAVLMGHDNAYDIACQEWSKWIENGWFDYVSPMAYTIHDEVVSISFIDTENLTKDKLFNLHGIASIIEGGGYINHFNQMKLVNSIGGLGSILFSIRQCIRDEKTYEMIAHVYKNNPSISLFSSLSEIKDYLINHLKSENSEIFNMDFDNLEKINLENSIDIQKAYDICNKVKSKCNDENKHLIDIFTQLMKIRSIRKI